MNLIAKLQIMRVSATKTRAVKELERSCARRIRPPLVRWGGGLALTGGLRRAAAEPEGGRALAVWVRGRDEFLRGAFREGIATLEGVLGRDPANVGARLGGGHC